MADPAPELVRWLSAARAGSPEALGRALEACRAYLLLVAARELDPALRAKGGASDLVQQTFLEAQRDFAAFHGNSEAELLAWLRRLLLNNVANFSRAYRGTGKRDVGREVALGAGGASGVGDSAVPADTPSPSSEFLAGERSRALQQALARLPEDYRLVIRYRYEEERPFEEIARLLNRSPNAVRKLWARAVERLQQDMRGPS
jgi:RNA polymerase sigma-70 factor (ECF subfamily)